MSEESCDCVSLATGNLVLSLPGDKAAGAATNCDGLATDATKNTAEQSKIKRTTMSYESSVSCDVCYVI